MNFDRNTVIGFIVLAVLFGGYFWWTSKEQSAARAERARQDSIARANAPIDTAALKTETTKNDSIARVKTAGGFQKAVVDEERTVVINNNVLEITFSTRGGQPKEV